MDFRVHLIASFLLDSCESSICFRGLSRLVNLSDSHLTHLFRRETGMSPQRFLKTARLQLARDFLETTFLSVKEVMGKTGYNDPSHFVRDFEKMFGESPYRYRQHHFRPECIRAVDANKQQNRPMAIDCNPRKQSA